MCSCCGCHLGDHKSLYHRTNRIFCKDDYLKTFGCKGECASCLQTILGDELVMRAKTNVYHLHCFICQDCGHRFRAGDRLYCWNNKILCEKDFDYTCSGLQIDQSGLGRHPLDQWAPADKVLPKRGFPAPPFEGYGSSCSE